MNLLEVSGWILTVLAVVGSLFNIYKSKWCFYIWGVCNVGFAIINYQKRIGFQVALFSVYLILEVWGVIRWYKEDREAKRKTCMNTPMLKIKYKKQSCLYNEQRQMWVVR